MHEQALYRDLRRKLDELSAGSGGHRITRVVVWLGALSHVSEASLARGWGELVAGGPAEGSRLVVERSEDPSDPRADGLVLRSIDLADPPPGPGVPGRS